MSTPTKYILGIDIGTSSVGWAVVQTDEEDNPLEVINLGSRVFEAGLDSLEKDGKGESRNAARRSARLIRRGLERHVRRLIKTAKHLQRMELLPEGDVESSESRHEYFNKLDKKIGMSVYELRADGLDKKLKPHELGRVFYSFSQRRGFKSNRKESSKESNDDGVVKSSIKDLASEIASSGARTLGEYFKKLQEDRIRVRTKYTARDMYNLEFEALCQQQLRHHAILSNEVEKKKLTNAIFYQRPLKSQKSTRGFCELIPKKRRADWSLLPVQEFRYLKTVNNLRLKTDSSDSVPLTAAQKQILIEYLSENASLSFTECRKLLGLKARSGKFNLEEGGEKRIVGNRTAAKFIEALGLDEWRNLEERLRDGLIELLRSVTSETALIRIVQEGFGFTAEQAKNFSEISLEDGVSAYSRTAIEMLLPLLREGLSEVEAKRIAFPELTKRRGAALTELPPVATRAALGDIKNPVVSRALTEVRRIVNAITSHYGKPAEIRVELGRDLRKTAKQRAEAIDRMRSNEKERVKAADRLLKECGLSNPRRDDILKVLLAEECNWKCPYTGTPIEIKDLVGAHPQFDIEHIIPFSRSADNSFGNLTLCLANENRNRKHNRTPYEAYHGTPQWDDIIARVQAFKGGAGKFRRFKMNDSEVDASLDDFSERQLVDTRVASKKARQYLGLLYGGVGDDGVDEHRIRRVQATGGSYTSMLRHTWGLNGLLSDTENKTRDDHRHHAIDAVVIALTTPALVKNLPTFVQQQPQPEARTKLAIPEPIPNLRRTLEQKLPDVLVSHKISKRVRGQLHKETFYSDQGFDERGKRIVHERIKLERLSKKDIPLIVDRVIRNIVADAVGDKEPKDTFKDPVNLPWVTAGTRRHQIRKVRIRYNLDTMTVGNGNGVRHVMSDSNHHMEIIETEDSKGKPKWEGRVVSLMEAVRRKRVGEPVIKRGPGFLFSIANGEILRLTDSQGRAKFVVVRSIPLSRQIRWVDLSEARPITKIPKIGQTAYPDGLREKGAEKVVITPLGEVRRAND